MASMIFFWAPELRRRTGAFDPENRIAFPCNCRKEAAPRHSQDAIHLRVCNEDVT